MLEDARMLLVLKACWRSDGFFIWYWFLVVGCNALWKLFGAIMLFGDWFVNYTACYV